MSAAVGSLAEEALRLLAALSGPPGGAESGTRAGGDPHRGGDGCAHCTVCRLVSALRATRPEVAAHLEDAAGSLLDAVQALRSPVASEPARDGGATGRTPDPAPARRIEIIDVS